MEINLDSAFLYGMGVFETILIQDSKAIMLAEHLTRLRNSLLKLGIENNVTEDEVFEYIKNNKIKDSILRITVSEKNKVFTTRENPYLKLDYKKGFKLNISKIRRNEAAITTYIKSINYLDNILTKKKAIEDGYDDSLFLNFSDYICETSVANIFFVVGESIFTPKLDSGLLPGIIRDYIIKRYEVTEKYVSLDELKFYDEAFITNSIIGIMPVTQIGNYNFKNNSTALKLLEDYKKN